MFKLNVNGKQGKYVLNLPTSMEEITPEYLHEVTKGIKIADDYSIIAVCYREQIGRLISAVSRKENRINSTTMVIPLFVDCGITESQFIKNIKCNEKVVITPSQLALSIHLTCPKNGITISNITKVCEGDVELYKKAMTLTEVCYFIDFKLVPNCDILANYKEINDHYDNPFVIPIGVDHK